MPLRILILLICLLFAATCFAQRETNADEIGIVYRKEHSFGPMLHTNGYGLLYRTGVNVTGFKKRMWEFGLYIIKHPKEARTVNPYYENARSFIYGKQYSLTTLAASRMWQHTIYSKGDKGGVEIRWHYTGGLLLGLYKPVYLRVIDTDAETIVVERYDPAKHSMIDIMGRAGLFTGFDQLKPRPGVHLATGFSFDFARNDDRVMALEVGAQFDIFAFAPPIMANNPNRPYFLNFYLAFLYGKKKN